MYNITYLIDILLHYHVLFTELVNRHMIISSALGCLSTALFTLKVFLADPIITFSHNNFNIIIIINFQFSECMLVNIIRGINRHPVATEARAHTTWSIN